ncbi:MAG TPA: hypothetical protein PLD20_06975 [Blastocatellia bacterium]|nr:hypothetical protein [Blastocatellia bacterium]HMV85292.1 hypothetical protein [Blastocatellia bacterium]HMY71221.1 hypothetical protein [Blastocatellia bacterium]HMZ17652.1 hypothetical protein [Blastocatellia bacterium]HNG29317.1 hypothetical protein [Blastocatellia bacterium]
MNKNATQPPSGAGTDSGEEHSAEQIPEDFDPAESAEQVIPIGVPMTDEEFRRMKSRAEQHSPPPPETQATEEQDAQQDPPEN